MSLSLQQQARYWGIAAVLFFALLWGLGTVMLPFLVGGAIAYFLDPVADRLEQIGLSRSTATSVISVIALMTFCLLGLLLVPMLVRQLIQLVNAAPTIFGELQAFLTTKFPHAMDSDSVVRQSLAALGKTIQSRGGELASGLLSSAMSVLNAVIFIVVVPVVAFYLLLDWDHMVGRIDAALPLDHRNQVRVIAVEVDRVLAAFVRGQVSVCLMMGAYYSTMLIVVGLQFGLVVGAIAGLVTFIPYVGALIGGMLAIGLALFQFWGDWVRVGMVVGIFAVGQFLEGNVITPRLVGKSVGLHPVWLLFALSAMGTLFGFVGMLVAVPAAAALGVLARFGIGQYLLSRLYRGTTGQDDG